MDIKLCKECQHFRQHYGIDQKKVFQVYCGHCVLHIRKKKRPDDKVCEEFLPRTEKVEAFVSKEYSSKALLDYMLQLELLPEILECNKDSQME